MGGAPAQISEFATRKKPGGAKAAKLAFKEGEALEEIIGFSDGTGFAVGVGPQVRIEFGTFYRLPTP